MHILKHFEFETRYLHCPS